MEDYEKLPENAAEFDTPENVEAIAESEEVEESFEDTMEILKMKDQIVRYSVSFGKYLTLFEDKIRRIDDMNKEQLKRLLHEIGIAVSARTSGNMMRVYYKNTICVAESLAPLVGMNLNGLSKVLLENQQIDECIEELNIKYDVMHHVGPEARLAFITVNAILAINSQNKKLQAVANVMDGDVKREHVEEYADL